MRIKCDRDKALKDNWNLIQKMKRPCNMTKPNYIDQCLERAIITDGKHPKVYQDTLELARRLKKACGLLRALKCSHYDTEWLADELEAIPQQQSECGAV